MGRPDDEGSEELQRWRTKCLRTLDELDGKERAWRDLEGELLRGLGRLANLAKGRNPSLDEHLDRIRKATLEAPKSSVLLELMARLTDFAVRTEQPDTDAREALALTSASLTNLLDRLELQGPRAGRAQELRALLKQTPPTDGTRRELAAGVLSLLNELCQEADEERSATERFLVSLQARLVEIDAYLQQPAGGGDEPARTRRDLADQVQGEVACMRSSVAGATDLRQLQQELQGRLDKVQAHVREYVATEERRAHEMDQERELLLDRLQRLEVERGILRDRVRTTQARAERDGLTGLYNRATYDMRVQEEWERWQRYAAPLSLTLLDLDHFKALNDRWGHQAGDKALQAVASKIQTLVRATDLVARYGGEEFVILMPSTTGQEALAAADKLRRELAGGAYHFRGTPIRLTVSCGVSEFGSGDTPESVLRRADEALYLAKREGRNQCRLDPGTPQHSALAFGHSALS